MSPGTLATKSQYTPPPHNTSGHPSIQETTPRCLCIQGRTRPRIREKRLASIRPNAKGLRWRETRGYTWQGVAKKQVEQPTPDDKTDGQVMLYLDEACIVPSLAS
ncbi:hypothetical protein IG631_05958 [Alternaria alternata]|nr:hypothetical protein IG631_05958 [Alternaria alternata]